MLLQKLIQPTLRGNSSFCSQVQWMVIWAVIWWHFDSCLQLARTFSPIMFSELWAIELFFLLLRTPVHSSYCNALWLNFSFFKGQLFSEHIFLATVVQKTNENLFSQEMAPLALIVNVHALYCHLSKEISNVLKIDIVNINFSFSNFSCMFLNPKHFFQFEFYLF